MLSYTIPRPLKNAIAAYVVEIMFGDTYCHSSARPVVADGRIIRSMVPCLISSRLLGLFYFGLLAANDLATRGLSLLAWHARILEIRLDRVRGLAIVPVTNIDYPCVDLERTEDPVRTILDSPIFSQTDEYLELGLSEQLFRFGK
jgi:hypothetical protein